MKPKTKALLDKVDQVHDFSDGQTYGGGGTRYSRTCVCRVCGLQRHWFDDKQNGIEDEYTFNTILGEEVSLIQASEMEH